MSSESISNSNDGEWEVEEAEVGRPVSVVVSVRLPSELAERLTLEASATGTAVSSLVREAVGNYLDAVETARAGYLTVSSLDVAVSFYAGRPLEGHTAGPAKTLEEAGFVFST